MDYHATLCRNTERAEHVRVRNKVWSGENDFFSRNLNGGDQQRSHCIIVVVRTRSHNLNWQAIRMKSRHKLQEFFNCLVRVEIPIFCKDQLQFAHHWTFNSNHAINPRRKSRLHREFRCGNIHAAHPTNFTINHNHFSVIPHVNAVKERAQKMSRQSGNDLHATLPHTAAERTLEKCPRSLSIHQNSAGHSARARGNQGVSDCFSNTVVKPNICRAVNALRRLIDIHDQLINGFPRVSKERCQIARSRWGMTCPLGDMHNLLIDWIECNLNCSRVIMFVVSRFVKKIQDDLVRLAPSGSKPRFSNEQVCKNSQKWKRNHNEHPCCSDRRARAFAQDDNGRKRESKNEFGCQANKCPLRSLKKIFWKQELQCCWRQVKKHRVQHEHVEFRSEFQPRSTFVRREEDSPERFRPHAPSSMLRRLGWLS